MDKIEQSFSTAATVDFVYDGGVVNGFLVSASNLVKEVYQKQGGASQKGDRFAYDEHQRLAKAWLGSDQTHLNATDPEAAVGTWHKKLTYGLDAANNRTSVASQPGPGGTVTTEAYSTQDVGETGGASNRYDAVGGVVPLYDQRGNTVFDGTFYYVYDDQNRLTEVYILQQEGSEALSTSSFTSMSSSQPSANALAARAANAGVYRVTDRTALDQARAGILTRLPGGPMEIVARAGEPGLGNSLRQSLAPAVAQRVAAGSSLQTSSSNESTSTQSSSASGAQMTLVALYLYDSANRRVMRSVIGVQTWFAAWDGWSEAQELILGVDGANVVVRPQRQFVWGEQLDELVSYRYRQPGASAWAEFFVAEGGAHCPSRVLNEAGAVVEVQEYDVYGKASFYSGSGAYVGVGTQAAVGNPFQWKGHRVDPETGLTYMRNRYYASAWGRFLTQDPLGVWGDPVTMGNGYGYGAASPLVQSDPMGLQVRLRVSGGVIQGLNKPGSPFAEKKDVNVPQAWPQNGSIVVTGSGAEALYNSASGGSLDGVVYRGIPAWADGLVDALGPNPVAAELALIAVHSHSALSAMLDLFTGHAKRGAEELVKEAVVGVALAGLAAVAGIWKMGRAAKVNPCPGATGGGGKVGGKITGYTEHGLDQATGRDGGRGVHPEAILDAVRNPTKVVEQAGGKIKYIGEQGSVVLSSEGKVVTTWGRPRNPVPNQ